MILSRAQIAKWRARSTRKATVMWADELAHTVLHLHDENERLREIARDALPSLGMNGRTYAQRALNEACALLDENPEAWTMHPDVLAQVQASDALSHAAGTEEETRKANEAT